MHVVQTTENTAFLLLWALYVAGITRTKQCMIRLAIVESSGSLMKVPVHPGLSPSSVSPIGWGSYPEWPVLLHHQILLFLICVHTLFPFHRGLTHPQCPATCFSQLTGNHDCSLHDLQP
jgi:hypothetical protein